ncbi:glycosyltransferase [Morganella morganii]|uniref:glycosyltransferase n=1 Tax=Morganella morganii TaxID=582 RepID=UPI000468ED27|nr:glycosyltransferase [Morganella morganii]
METNKKKLITIITISYNSEKYIERAINSVINNKKKDLIEYIVIDGKSTDKTKEIVQSHIDKIDVFISENDFGIAHAFNKGILRATGKYICFLNSDDYFENSALDHIINSILEDDILPDIYYGNTIAFSEEKSWKKKKYTGKPWVSLPFTFGASFYKFDLFEKYGIFDINKKIAMDVDFILRFWSFSTKKDLDINILNQSVGGISDRHRVQGYIEYFNSSRKQYGLTKSILGLGRKMAALLYHKMRNLK